MGTILAPSALKEFYFKENNCIFTRKVLFVIVVKLLKSLIWIFMTFSATLM